MKIGIITDIHFGVRNDSPVFLDNLIVFLDNCFFPTLLEEGIKTVLILGDTWQNRRNINIHTLHVAQKKFFSVLHRMGIEVKMVYGNHDVFFKNTNDINSVDFLERQYDNIEVIDIAKVFTFDNIKIGMMSWIPNNNKEPYLKFLAESECDILCGHFEINSFEMTAGNFCSDGLDKKVFQRYPQVYSGHFHIPSSDGRITYLGNPAQTNWGDYGVEKGAWYLDTDTQNIIRIINPHQLYDKVYYNDDIDIISFDFTQYTGKIVRMFVDNFLVVNKKNFELFTDRLNDSVYDLEVHESDHSAELANSEDIESATDCANTVDIISLYVNGIDFNSSIDKGRFREMVIDVYKEASERIVV